MYCSNKKKNWNYIENYLWLTVSFQPQKEGWPHLGLRQKFLDWNPAPRKRFIFSTSALGVTNLGTLKGYSKVWKVQGTLKQILSSGSEQNQPKAIPHPGCCTGLLLAVSHVFIYLECCVPEHGLHGTIFFLWWLQGNFFNIMWMQIFVISLYHTLKWYYFFSF